jgi:hypothetical protein
VLLAPKPLTWRRGSLAAKHTVGWRMDRDAAAGGCEPALARTRPRGRWVRAHEGTRGARWPTPGHAVLLDAPMLEQQLLGLIWRGGKITHPSGEHDDFATVAAGVVEQVLGPQPVDPELVRTCLA